MVGCSGFKGHGPEVSLVKATIMTMMLLATGLECKCPKTLYYVFFVRLLGRYLIFTDMMTSQGHIFAVIK